MPQLCVSINGNATCIPMDLTVFDDPRQDEVDEMPGETPGDPATTGGAAVVRTEVARGAVPRAWPRRERTVAEFVKGSERIRCEVLVRSAEGQDDAGEEILLFGEDVFRGILGRAP